MKHAGRILRDQKRLTSALQEQTAIERCPTCHRPMDLSVPKRFCAACGQQITRYHKWCIGEDGRIRHRFCERPDSYK